MSAPLAHSQNEAGRSHLLKEHLEAVADLAREFARHFDSGDYAACAGRLHDLGKYAPGFQDALRRAMDAHIEGRSGYGDHASAGAILALDKLGRAGEAITLAVAGHHAGLGNRVEVIEGRLKLADLRQRLLASLACPEAAGIVVGPLRPPAFLVGMGERDTQFRRFEFWVRMLFSCLVDADFLDTERHFLADRASTRGNYLCIAELKAMYDGYMSDPRFTAGEGEVNSVRRAVLADCRRVGRESDRGVFTLTAPTGCGKTLAAMGFALEHAGQREMDRVIVVIPYTSIIDQNVAVYRRVFGARNVIAHHSSLDPVTEDRETPLNRIACENWDAPIIVTTSVQFVESLFANKTSRCRKLHNVCNSVVIFDEVQTLPIGRLEPILDVLKELVANYKVSLVLSTATQPALRRRENFVIGFESATEIVSNVPATFEALRRVEVTWPPDLDKAREWPDLAVELLGCEEVLCVVHRRDDARTLAALIPGSIHLSALMCAAHRLAVIEEVKTRLRKNRERRAQGEKAEPVRLISTQLIEAGVDVDFPVVYRALGGLDSIAQTAGRCNREGLLSGRGEVRIFVAPTDPPKGTPRLGLSATRTLRAATPALDAMDPAAYDAYFRELYFLHSDFDEADDQRRRVQSERAARNFANVADLFRMIEEDGSESVVVPYGDAEDRLRELRNHGPNRERLRGLQVYLVKIHARLREALVAAGAIEQVAESVWAVVMPGYRKMYDARLGLQTEGVVTIDSSHLMM